LGADTALTASTVTAQGAVAGSGKSLTVTGNAVFGGAVNGLTALAVSGTSAINGGSVTGVGTQTYNGTVTLGANTALSGSGITFNGAVTDDGNPLTGSNLTINSAGAVVVKGAVGVTALSGLAVNGAAKATFGSNVTTVGDQAVTAESIQTNGTHATSGAGAGITLTGNMVLQGSTRLNTGLGNGNITVTGTVNAAIAGLQSLRLTAGSGNIELRQSIGGSAALSAVTVTGAGKVRFGGNVTTSTVQTITATTIQTNGNHVTSGVGAWIRFSGNVVLEGNTRLSTMVSNGNITVGGTINANGTGSPILRLAAGSGAIDLQQGLGGGAALGGLVVTGAGTVRFGGDVKTTGTQGVTAGIIQTNGTHTTSNAGAWINLAGNVVLQGNTRFNTGAGNGNITVGGTINANGVVGGRSLTLTAGGGNIEVRGVIGGSSALSSLTVTSAGQVTFGGAVTTIGNVAQVAGSGTTTLRGGTVGGNLSLTTNAIVLSAAPVLTTGPVILNAKNDVTLNAGLNASASTILILANQDGVGSQGFTQGVGAAITTANDTAYAVTITVNTGRGTGTASIGKISAGTTPTSAGGRVMIVANGGAIIDGDAGVANNITAGNAMLIARGGIGAAGDPIETVVSNLLTYAGASPTYVANTRP
jgi:hypothetical protein